jgi:hypothetical protein
MRLGQSLAAPCTLIDWASHSVLASINGSDAAIFVGATTSPINCSKHPFCRIRPSRPPPENSIDAAQSYLHAEKSATSFGELHGHSVSCLLKLLIQLL